MTENQLCNEIIKSLKLQIENEFNAKVFECGFYSRNMPVFEKLKPLGALPPNNAEHIFYILVPLDDADNIITNNYYKLYQAAHSGLMFSPSKSRASYAFQEILREDFELVNFIYRTVDNHV